jgi:hypothetical protein
MVRPHAWVWALLATSAVVAASCSSSDTKKKPVTYDPNASGAGAGGDGTQASAGSETDGGVGTSPNAGAGGDAAGGSGDGIVTDGWLSGTRLRATLYVAGSSKLFKTWHDTLLDVDCNFAFDADGVERCLPGFEHGYGAYSDSKCTKPVLALDADAEVPDFVMAPPPPFECSKGTRYLKVGASVAGVTELYSNSSGSCQSNGSVGATQIVKTLGAAVPNAMFVAASDTVQEPRDERLLANVRVAEDGSRQVISHFDVTRKADCNPREHEGDGYGCVPEDRAYIEYFFADDQCTTEAAYHPAYAQQVCGRDPTIIQNSSPYFTDGYYEVGDLVPNVFRKDGRNCDPYTSSGDPGASYYLVGKAVPFTSFAALSSKNEGKGRILLQVLRGAADELISREDFYDATLGTACAMGQTTDLEPRCVPRYTSGVNVYADAKCSQGLLTTAMGVAPIERDKFLQANSSGGGSVIYQLGAKLAKPAKVFQYNGPDCLEQVVDAGSDYYSTTIVAPSELAPVTLETE